MTAARFVKALSTYRLLSGSPAGAECDPDDQDEGVAVDDWTVERLVERARESIVGTGNQLDEEVFRRFASRLSYVPGDFGDAATYERVADAIQGARLPVFYLETPPFLFGRVVKGL